MLASSLKGWRAFALAVALVVVCLGAAGAFPRVAYAWLNEVTDSYPASQTIAISGDVLTGADVPEGTYSVNVETSSYMCKMTNATLTSAGGELWVTFTLSKAYNALYFGTAEDAASLSEEESEDYSPYITVDPIEGYVAREFTLPIPALNYEITLATFSGGNKSTKKGLWYTRSFVVHSSAEIEEAVAGGGGEDEPSGGDDSGGDSGQDGSGDDSGQDDSGQDDSGDTGDGSDEVVTDDETDDADDADDTSSSTSSRTTRATNAGTTQNDDGSTGNDEATQSEGSSSKSAAKKTKKGAKIGTVIRIVDPSELIVEQQLAEVEAAQAAAEQKEDGMATVAAGMAVANAVLAGAFVLGVRHARPRRRVLDQIESTIEG